MQVGCPGYTADIPWGPVTTEKQHLPRVGMGHTGDAAICVPDVQDGAGHCSCQRPLPRGRE